MRHQGLDDRVRSRVGAHLDLAGHHPRPPRIDLTGEHRRHQVRGRAHLVDRDLAPRRRRLRGDPQQRPHQRRRIQALVTQPPVLLPPHPVRVDHVLDRGDVRDRDRLHPGQRVAHPLPRLEHRQQPVPTRRREIGVPQRIHHRGGGRLQVQDRCVELHDTTLRATTDSHRIDRITSGTAELTASRHVDESHVGVAPTPTSLPGGRLPSGPTRSLRDGSVGVVHPGDLWSQPCTDP